MGIRASLVGLVATIGMAVLAIPAQAQNSFERGVILFLDVQHRYEDFERDSQADWIGALRRPGQSRQVDHVVQLEAGKTYRIIGSCDTDCDNMDMQVFSPTGEMVGEDIGFSDRPYVEVTPEVTGAFRVHPWVVTCRARPCYGGVRVLVRQPQLRSGTAFLISADGYLLTAAHVVENRENISIHTGQGTVAARVIVRDPANDVALLQAELSGTPLHLATATNLRRGQEVMTLGYPLVDMQGESQKASFGRVNALSGLEDDVRYLQVDTPIQPGNSGGPLLNAAGEVVGIVTATINQRTVIASAGTVAQNVNYALKTDYILPLIPAEARPMQAVEVSTAGFEETAARAEPSVYRITAE